MTVIGARRHVGSLWVGGSLSYVEILCLKAFLKRGYRFTLFSYQDLGLDFEGVEVADANEIVSAERLFRNPTGTHSYAGFSNLFRYELLASTDIIWVDLDILPGAQPLPKTEYLFGFEDDKYVNGAVLHAPRESIFVEELRRRAFAVKPDDVRWGMLGPKLISSVVSDLGLGKVAQTADVFYPIGYKETWRLFDPHSVEWVLNKVSTAATVHLWNEVLRQSWLKPKYHWPPAGSYLDYFLRECEIERPISQRRMNPRLVRTIWKWQLGDWS